MRVKGHIYATITISGIILFVYNSISAFISSLVSGILIDIDHLLDYYLHRGADLRIKRFFNWCYKNEWQRLILLFHSIELVLILWLCIFVFNLGLFWIGFAVGITQHMVLDIIFNSEVINAYSYFFLYRLSRGFSREYIIRRG